MPNDSTCSIPGCAKPPYARGWCAMHYTRWQRHGDPLITYQLPPVLCLVDGCERQADNRKRALCGLHNHRFERTGDPIGIRQTKGLMDAPTIARFRRHIPEGLTDVECWPWLGACHIRGYGIFYYGADKWIYAHRMAYMVCAGSDPGKLHVLHTCDNPPCVNHSHLRAGTHEDNMRDKVLRGRARNGATGSLTYLQQLT